MAKITLKLNFSKRQEERGSNVTRKEYVLYYLSKAKMLVLSDEHCECLIEGFFYPGDIRAINHFVQENPEIAIEHSSLIAKGGHCTISIVKSNKWLSLNSKGRLITSCIFCSFRFLWNLKQKAIQSRWIFQIDCMVLFIAIYLFSFFQIYKNTVKCLGNNI